MSSGFSPEPNVRLVTAKLPSDIKPSAIGLFTSRFNTIPPERVGLNGEYDHYGLAKRVLLAFNQEFSAQEIAELKIRQRGGVVILMGRVSSRRLLTRMIHIALRVNGATDVETYGVSIEPHRDFHRELPCESTSPHSVRLRLVDFPSGHLGEFCSHDRK